MILRWMILKRISASLLLLLAACLAGCREAPAVDPKVAEDPKVAKIRITAAGEVTVDGKPMTMDQLDRRLARLKAADGTVWYYRENPEDDPHPNAMLVLDHVMVNGVPIRMSSKPDFSDSIDENGESVPVTN